MKHKLPKTLPGDWIAALKTPSRDGCYEAFTVVRKTALGSYDKYQVHSAYWNDEAKPKAWVYACGDYCKTLDEALASFAKRSGLSTLNAEG
jgi:hypothetical protein